MDVDFYRWNWHDNFGQVTISGGTNAVNDLLQFVEDEIASLVNTVIAPSTSFSKNKNGEFQSQTRSSSVKKHSRDQEKRNQRKRNHSLSGVVCESQFDFSSTSNNFSENLNLADSQKQQKREQKNQVIDHEASSISNKISKLTVSSSESENTIMSASETTCDTRAKDSQKNSTSSRKGRTSEIKLS